MKNYSIFFIFLLFSCPLAYAAPREDAFKEDSKRLHALTNGGYSVDSMLQESFCILSRMGRFLLTPYAIESIQTVSLSGSLNSLAILTQKCKHSDFIKDQKESIEYFLTSIVRASILRMGSFRARDLAVSLYGLSKLLTTQSKLSLNRRVLYDFVRAWSIKATAELRNFNTQGFANSLWALAKLVETGHLDSLDKDFLHAWQTEGMQKLTGFNATDYANSLWALAKLVENGQLEYVSLAWVSLWQQEVYKKLDEFKCQDVSDSFWALAKLAETGKFKHLSFPVLIALQEKIHRELAVLNPQQISDSLWALALLVETAHLSTVKPGLLNAIQFEANRKLPRFTSKNLSSAIWALAQFVKRGQLKNINVYFLHNWQEAAMRKLLMFHFQEISSSINSLIELVEHGEELRPDFLHACSFLIQGTP